MSLELFDKNIEALSASNPGLAHALSGLRGSPSLENPPPFATDHFDPACKGDVILAFGCEILLSLTELPGSEMKETFIVALEPRVDILALTLASADLTELLRSPFLSLHHGTGCRELFIGSVVKAFISRHAVKVLMDDEENPQIKIISLESRPFSQNKTICDSRDILNEISAGIDKNSFAMSNISKVRNSARELSEYLGENIFKVAMRIIQAPLSIVDDWNAARPENPGQIYEWYKSTDSYMYELCMYHNVSSTYPDMAKTVEEICHKRGGAMLDFGGGDGDMVIRLAKKGLDITYCDVPGKTMEYALWRFSKRGLNVPVIVSSNPDTIALERKFDIILALDVLEHLYDPLHYCRVFFENLNPGGVFIAKPSFASENGSEDDTPMHLAKNAPLNKSFDDEMMKIGFAPALESTDLVSVWQKPVA